MPIRKTHTGKSRGPSSRGVFLDSLDQVRPEELSPDAPVKKKRRFGVYDALLILCLAVFAVCAALLVRGAFDTQRSSDLYDRIAAGLFDEPEGSEDSGLFEPLSPGSSASLLYSQSELLARKLAGEEAAVPEVAVQNVLLARVQARLAELKAKNPDIYAFIRIEDTNISYPVTITYDNDFYLHHDPENRGYLDHGSIFADFQNDRRGIEYNRNTVLYGHNMTTGRMFHELIKFNDAEFFRTHLIYLYTLNGLYVYQPFAFFRTVADYNYFQIRFSSDADFIAFAERMKENSLYETDVTFAPGDRILTLSTCTNVTTDGRYSLQAKLIRIEK